MNTDDIKFAVATTTLVLLGLWVLVSLAGDRGPALMDRLDRGQLQTFELAAKIEAQRYVLVELRGKVASLTARVDALPRFTWQQSPVAEGWRIEPDPRPVSGLELLDRLGINRERTAP
jgi:hypothetical protein